MIQNDRVIKYFFKILNDIINDYRTGHSLDIFLKRILPGCSFCKVLYSPGVLDLVYQVWHSMSNNIIRARSLEFISKIDPYPLLWTLQFFFINSFTKILHQDKNIFSTIFCCTVDKILMGEGKRYLFYFILQIQL